MKTHISEVLEAVRANIASSLSANVILGAPDDSAAGLYLFPYLWSEDPGRRSTVEEDAVPGFTLQCLLMTSPPDDYRTLDAGLGSLREQPVLSLGERSIRISLSFLSADEVAGIFAGAGVPLRLAIPFQLNWSGS